MTDLSSIETWAALLDERRQTATYDSDLAQFLEPFRTSHPSDLTVALDPDVAARNKAELAAFLLSAVQSALADHLLSEPEVATLRHVARLFRIEEGELSANWPEEVARIVRQELERLLNDDRIDFAEAVHKSKLQEVLGLGYDDIVRLSAPQIELVLLRLLRRVDTSATPRDIAENINWFRGWLSELDAVYNMNGPEFSDSRSGYVYLLMNPAMPGIVKIGRTSRPPATRVTELSGATGVPVPFDLLFDIHVLDCEAAEAHVHRELQARGYRVAQNREFFSAPASEAVEIMLRVRDEIGGFAPIAEAEPR
jgi:DnaJ-domain-containing protein 1